MSQDPFPTFLNRPLTSMKKVRARGDSGGKNFLQLSRGTRKGPTDSQGPKESKTLDPHVEKPSPVGRKLGGGVRGLGGCVGGGWGLKKGRDSWEGR